MKHGLGATATLSAEVIFMGALYLLAVGIYIGARMYRSRQGIDLGMVYKEIPVE